MFLSSQHKQALTEGCRPLRVSTEFLHLITLLETTQDLLRSLLWLNPLIALIAFYHVRFTEVLQLPVFIPQNDSKQTFYRDASS